MKRKIKISQEQGMAISFALERLRLSGEDNYGYHLTKEILQSLEDTLDTKIWGKKYVANRRSDSEQRGK